MSKGQSKTCRFYDAVRGGCVALNCVYCEREDKPCSFYRAKGGNGNGNDQVSAKAEGASQKASGR